MATVAMMKAREAGEDPDAQATVTDYLDYTEYLPSDLNRAVTLIRKLDETYLERTNNVHELTKEWARVSPWANKPMRHSQTLRQEISYNLQHAIKARESAYGEAERLNEMVNRYYNRLTGIKSKLLALPKPPSRDPTPVVKSPKATKKTPTRITLRLDGGRQAVSTGRLMDKEKKRLHRNRRITIPGEVLPPPNPDSPQEYSESDWDSLPPSPLPIPTSRVGGSRSRSHKRLKAPKIHKHQKDRAPRPPRPPGMGTNVHSQIAGISTSNALSMLPKPPPDAQSGSEHAPWMRLTEYEMALLRKRMKKNAIWTPSETMIRRELAAAGRGPDNYRKRRLECDKTGEEFLDLDNIAESSPDKPLLPGEIRADDLGPISESLSNRGMKLNEAKKQKREAMLEASRLETQQATKRIEDLGTNFKLLFEKPRTKSFGSPLTPGFSNGQQRPPDQAASKKRKNTVHDRESDGSKASKRRKTENSEVTPELAAARPTRLLSGEVDINTEKATPSRRKGDLSLTAKNPATTKVPLAAPGPAVSERSSRRLKSNTPASSATPQAKMEHSLRSSQSAKDQATPSRHRRRSLTLRGPASPGKTDAAPRSSSRKASLQNTTTPSSAASLRERPRRQSATPITPATITPALTAAGRRSKRPAPGAVLQNEEGGAAVTIGRRERPPRYNQVASNAALTDSSERKGSARAKGKALQDYESGTGEFIDPTEPRYCICGDVSWGNMVCCDNDDCEREWFHFGCVGLTANPSRRTKWYCPDCKVKLGKS